MEELLFPFRPDKPMRVAVFGSGSGTILRAMLAAQKQMEKKGKTPFKIELLYTDRPCNFQIIAKEESLPLLYHPRSSQQSREEYDHDGLALFKTFEPVDFLLLAGYMRLMSSVWLQAFPYKILNIHPADLTALDPQGKRKWVGENAVFKALQGGMRKTRTSAILIDATVDGGPIVVSGSWVLYEEGEPIDLEKAARHQEKQKAKSDWPACLAALQLIAEGRMGFDSHSGKIFLDGVELPPCGYEMKDEAEHVRHHWDLRIPSHS